MNEYENISDEEVNEKICSAIVFLDDNVPEYMDGIIRVGSVTFFNAEGKEIRDVALNNQLVDNSEFHSKSQLIKSVAKRLGLSVEHVTVEY